VKVTASDWDEADNGRVVYSIPPDIAQLFHVDQHGVLSVHTAVDREAHETFRFPVLAVDGGSPALSGSALVIINVEDLDDEQPHFVQQEFHFDVVENEASAGAQVGFLLAEDRDGAPYNAFVYAFHSGDQISEAAFAVDSETGAVTLRHSLDRERRAQHRFVVVAYNPKSPESSGTAAVVVDVVDRNDNAPQFSDTGTGNDSVLQISSLTPSGHVIAVLPASDADDGENAQLTYSLSADESSSGDVTRLFRVDARRGAVSVNSALPTSDLFRLLIVVADHGTPSLSASVVLTVYVNKSLPFQPLSSAASTAPYGDSGLSLSSTSAFNLVMLVAVVCGCAVVIFILVVVIALVRHRDRRHHARKYNCRMEALRVITSGGADAPEVANAPLSSIAAKSTSTSTATNPLHNGLRTTTTFPVHEVNSLTTETVFCRAMLRCISAAYVVMRCLSVCLSVTFVHSVKTNKDIFEIFSPSGSHTILVFTH